MTENDFKEDIVLMLNARSSCYSGSTQEEYNVFLPVRSLTKWQTVWLSHSHTDN